MTFEISHQIVNQYTAKYLFYKVLNELRYLNS